MKYIDFHCDTITELHDHPEKGSLLKNSLYVDLEKLKKGGLLHPGFCPLGGQEGNAGCVETV